MSATVTVSAHELGSPAEGALAGDYEKLVVCNDPRAGLRAVICIHSTALGPANGGVRMRPYPSHADAVRDAVALAAAMTRKWAAAGENRGGGKAVIIGDPEREKSEALLRRFGQFVDDLRGEFYVGEDAGITLADMETIHIETDYVATLPVEAGGVGDIAPATAAGVLAAMRAGAQRAWGSPDLAGRRIALQGLGACGSIAARMLHAAGARLLVADVAPARVETIVSELDGVEAVDPAAIHALDVDVFAPFAFGGAITRENVAQLKAKVIVGSANNVLAEPELARELDARGIVHVPDFIANAGGAIYDAEQFRKGGFNRERAMRNVEAIFDRALHVFALADAAGVTVVEAAERLAAERLEGLGVLCRTGRARR